MRLSYVQFSPCLSDLQQTLDRLDGHLKTAACADLVVLPELCNSGYNFVSKQQATDTAETIDGKFVEYLIGACRRHDFHIVSGLNERNGDKLYNSAVLVGTGGVLGRYRKLHLFGSEKDVFQPGDLGVPSFQIGDVRIGMLVCFDWAFPEVWRIMALQDVDIVCHPSNLVIPDLAQRAIPGYALTNRYYVVTANRIGTEGDLTFTGMSMIADPLGKALVEGPPDRAHVDVVEVDVELSRKKQLTSRNHLLGDRRTDVYRQYFA